jgi:2-oxoisovalerate dehydrogenase E1 component
MGTSGIVGPCILQAAGAGYSFKLLKTDQVAVAFFGDGAVNNGAFHEGLNMAGIWKLPVLFVCENNQFATEVPFRYAAGNTSVALRGASYGLPGVEVDGNNISAVYQAAEEAVARARSGGGPTLIECKTYRTRPHAEGMGDYTYRTREEVTAWRERCPIKRLRSLLIADLVATKEELDAIDAEVLAQVTTASQAAEQAPQPDAERLLSTFTAKSRHRGKFLNRLQEIGKSDLRPLLWKCWTLKWRANPAFSSWVKASARGVATLLRRRVYSRSMAPSASVTRRSASAVSWARLRRRDDRYPAGHRFHVHRFHQRCFRRDCQSNRQDSVHEQRAAEHAILLRGCVGIGHSAATHHSGSYHSIFSSHPRIARGHAFDTL